MVLEPKNKNDAAVIIEFKVYDREYDNENDLKDTAANALAQSQLSAESGVPCKQIQLFEQRQRDINKTVAETLLRLSRLLYCRMEDLMEHGGSLK